MKAKTKVEKPKPTRKRKNPKIPGFMRQVLAENCQALMDLHYREAGDRPMALSKDAGVSKSTIQRILAAEIGASLDNIEAVAGALHASSYQLLIPNLSPTKPQEVQGALKDEERKYRQWKKADETRTANAP